MTDASLNPAAPKTLLTTDARTRSRRAAEMRFRMIGLSAVLLGLVALVFLMVSILGNGVGAFRQTFVEIPVMLDPAALDKSGNRDVEQMKKVTTVGYGKLIEKALEAELVARNIDPNQPVIPPMGRSGRRAAGKQAYSLSAIDEYGKVIDDIYDFAEAQGLEIDGILQEGGAGQIELNLAHGDPVRLADDVFFFKRLIREAALRHDCFATFMAKPIAGEPGSAMHIHHSVVDTQTGKNIFSDAEGGETPEFLQFIAGMQNHMSGAIALLAPYVNSYRRYVPDFAAPINLEWGRDNRTTGLRVPISGPEGRRVENRLPGMDCNPYLGIAASLACGYLGLMEKKMPRPEFAGSAYIDSDDIPTNLGDALDMLEEDAALCDTLGKEFCNVYDSVKRNEYKEFLQVISPWEREHLLLNV